MSINTSRSLCGVTNYQTNHLFQQLVKSKVFNHSNCKQTTMPSIYISPCVKVRHLLVSFLALAPSCHIFVYTPNTAKLKVFPEQHRFSMNWFPPWKWCCRAVSNRIFAAESSCRNLPLADGLMHSFTGIIWAAGPESRGMCSRLSSCHIVRKGKLSTNISYIWYLLYGELRF